MMKFLYVIFVHLSLAYRLFYVNKKGSKKLVEELQEVLRAEGYSLNRDLAKRIRKLTEVMSLTNQWFCTLTGKKESEKERKCALYLGAVTLVFDDLQDTLKVSSRDILKVLDNSDDLEPATAVLLKYLYQKIITFSVEGFEEDIQYTLKAQDKSLKQIATKRLTDDEIRAIDYEKGGSLMILLRRIISIPLVEGEKEALYDLGYLIQQTDNMFDVYEDYQDGIQTLYTNSTDFEKADFEFRKKYRQTNLKFLKLEYDSKNIERFLCEVSILLVRGLICSEQHIACQKRYNGFIDISKVERRELICDMEKPMNIIKSIRYMINRLGQIRQLKQSV